MCVATAESVIVHFDGQAHKSRPLPPDTVAYLRELMAGASATSATG